MQFRLFVLASLATIAAADENLSQIIDDFPSCALPCLSQKAQSQGCQVTDFNCICRNTVSIAAGVGICVGNACSGDAAASASMSSAHCLLLLPHFSLILL